MKQYCDTDFQNDSLMVNGVGGNDKILGTDATGKATFYDLGNGYTIFPIWAEESADLAAGTATEWSFGNGDETPAVQGIPVPINCELFALTATVQGGNATIRILVNGANPGAAYQISVTAPSALNTLSTPLAITAGQVINFQTVSSSGANTNSGRICGWFRVKTNLVDVSDDLISTVSGVQGTGKIIATHEDGLGNTTQIRETITTLSSPGFKQIQYINENGATTNLDFRPTSAKIQNTALINNINSGGILTGYNATELLGTAGTDFTTAVDGITCNFNGQVKLMFNAYVISTVQRSNVGFRWVNGATTMAGYFASTYNRAVSGHNESSSGGSDLINVTSGDKIQIEKIALAAGTATSDVDIPANGTYLTLMRVR